MVPHGKVPVGPSHATITGSRMGRLRDRLTFRSRSSSRNPHSENVDWKKSDRESQAQAEDAGTLSATESNLTVGNMIPAMSPEDRVLRPISEVWSEAYRMLKDEDPKSIAGYESHLSRGLGSAIIISGAGRLPVTDRTQLQSALEGKVKEIEDGAWKLNFKKHELVVKDLIAPVVSLVGWAKDYVGKAIDSSGPGSLAWAGVCLCELYIRS